MREALRQGLEAANYTVAQTSDGLEGIHADETGYALSRISITRTDAGGRTFNFAEAIGTGTSPGISNIYYSQEIGQCPRTSL